ncbi:MAG: glycosyltransferase [Eubacterium sp.]|nr:glycosyltransferase [Eubacterium sp.]
MKLSERFKKPAVSVIVPVYNVQDYLEQCLDSIAAQTFTDYELICVNDGSTDSSPEILNRYAAKDSRIRIINQENLTLGVARNNGLKAAVGKYVIWLDSDDFFEPGLLEKTYSKAVETKADIVMCALKSYDNLTGRYYPKKGLNTEYLGFCSVFSKEDIPDRIMQVTLPNVWTKLFRRQFLLSNKLSFPKLLNTEDLYFTNYSLCLAKRISYVNEALVYYRINRPGSLENTKNANPLCCVEADTLLYDELNKSGIYEQVKLSYVNHAVEHFAYEFWRLRDDKDALEAVKKELKNSFLPHTHILEYPDDSYIDLETVKKLREL